MILGKLLTNGLLSLISSLFKQTSLPFLPQIYVKNVHSVYSDGIRNHDLRIMSLLPLPLDPAPLDKLLFYPKYLTSITYLSLRNTNFSTDSFFECYIPTTEGYKIHTGTCFNI